MLLGHLLAAVGAAEVHDLVVVEYVLHEATDFVKLHFPNFPVQLSNQFEVVLLALPPRLRAPSDRFKRVLLLNGPPLLQFLCPPAFWVNEDLRMLIP